MEGEEADKEIPLEIQDYSCNTYFEEVVREIEQYLVEEFRTREELQCFLANPVHPSGVKPRKCSSGVVSRRAFALGRQSDKKGDAWDGDGIAVEVHVYSNPNREEHPISRFFALPLFFLVRSTTSSASYAASESSYYLSFIVTAVGRVMCGPLTLHFDSDPSTLPSPFFYADGTAPCLVSIGDHYQLAFSGVAPPVMITEETRNATPRWTLRQLVSKPVVKRRFQCSAYPRPPEWCQNISDCLDMFQLQIGTQSRLRTDVFDGICVSLQQTFQLRTPRRFPMSYEDGQDSRVDAREESGAMLTWDDVLEIENETMLLCTDPSTFPFGTGTAPLRGIHFTFQWNRLHDTEVHDNGKWNFISNPFLPDGVQLQNKLMIKATALPKKECELNHTACRGISEYAYVVIEHIALGGELNSQQFSHAALDAMADEIVYDHMGSSSSHKALIDRLMKHLAGDVSAGEDIRNVYSPGSLICRFAYICATRLDGVGDVLFLWDLIVKRLKKLLEGGVEERHSLQQLIETIGVPDVEEIEHELPLLMQKLQFLSYCVKRILSENESSRHKFSCDGWEEDNESHHLRDGEDVLTDGSDAFTAVGFVSPTKCLITNGEPLVEPRALPTTPCTSDVLLFRAQELLNLGTASAGQNSRAWMQSRELFNDMCLFLYVNRAHEGRVVRFPDFVQWHSPRDFVSPSDNPKGGLAEKDDDAYLSKRMRRHSEGGSTNLWWPLWNQATPRSPSEIVAHSFVPHEQARLIIRWMEKDFSALSLLIETVHANFSNSLHRLLSHRCIESNPAIGTYALRKSTAIARSLKAVAQIDVSCIDADSLRSTYISAIRQIGEIETCVCAALAIERVLGASHESVSELASGTPCTSVNELLAVLSSPCESEEGGEDSSGLTLREATLLWDVWHHGGILQRFAKADQKPVEMLLRATCMAERPINTASCFQQMIAEVDKTGVFHVALTLAEEFL